MRIFIRINSVCEFLTAVLVSWMSCQTISINDYIGDILGMKLFVIGGAGYIGSHFIRYAIEKGHECVVYDNLSTGHKEALPKDVPLIEGNILDEELLGASLKNEAPDVVLHYAALALVGESVQHPDLYYRNNVQGVTVLLDIIKKMNKKPALVFSSSCAVFGDPEKLPVAEDDRKIPCSPYGRSKLVAEFIIEDYARAYGFRAMALRYFNACGAHVDGDIGEDHEPETHLIPNVIKSVQTGQELTIFGDDFDTRDGSCLRDYIHVTDLASSHVQAAEELVKEGSPFEAIHLGTGNGLTNLEIVKTVGSVLDLDVKFTIGARRSGDAAGLYADNRKAKDLLGFKAEHSNIENIIKTAVKWHEKNPNGYNS